VIVIHSVEELVAEIRARSRGAAVFVVALDGRSGTGKSSVAASLGTELGAAAGGLGRRRGALLHDDQAARELRDRVHARV